MNKKIWRKDEKLSDDESIALWPQNQSQAKGNRLKNVKRETSIALTCFKILHLNSLTTPANGLNECLTTTYVAVIDRRSLSDILFCFYIYFCREALSWSL